MLLILLFDIGRRWNLGGDDQGLVMVIVNDEIHGGNYNSFPTPSIFGTVSIGRKVGINSNSISWEQNNRTYPKYPNYIYRSTNSNHYSRIMPRNLFRRRI